MYTDFNFKTKKDFIKAVQEGKKVLLFSPGLGTPKLEGTEYVEGPHYPDPHTWYAQVSIVNGLVVKVK